MPRLTAEPAVPAALAPDAGGLSSARARELLARLGPNAIPQPRQSAWRRVLAHFWAPVPWMLEAVIVLQLVLGRDVEAIVIGALLVFNAAVASMQERRAANALELLRQRLPVRARALRDGAWQAVPAEDLVPGDVVHLRAGDLVPADVTLRDGAVSLDQATLTGESLPVDATATAAAYASTVVRHGEATGVVTATGARTAFGRTAELVRTATAPSHMQRTIFAIVERLAIFDALLAVLVVAFALWLGLPPLEIATFVLMLLVASVPVALPATYTLATAVSSLELARANVLVTRLPAVEEAAAMDTLVADKTGTLTQNALTLAGVEPAPGQSAAVVLHAAALASDASTQDPLDLALLRAAQARGLPDPAAQRRRYVPFDPATRRSEGEYVEDGAAWRAVKGAPEVVLAACGGDAQKAAWLEAAQRRLAAEGARVLAVARGDGAVLDLLGLVALADPPRPDARALVAALRDLGVRVRMATGDAPATARAIGARVGLGDRVCGSVPDAAPAADECDIYARVLPADKQRLVRALQHAGHVTGMTGDGVNDAPALRQAELGVAVAAATDVAKAAAGVVLTDAGLGGIVAVVRAGRAVHRRLLTYTLNKTMKTLEIVVFLTLGLLLTGQFLISATLIVLLLFANDFVTMTIATDRVVPPPRPQRWQVARILASAGALAALSLAFTLAVYAWIRATRGLDAGQLQTVVFVLLVFTNQANVYVLRTDGPLWRAAPSRWMALASAGDVAAVVVLAGAGWLMAPLPWPLLAALCAVTAAFALVLDAVKGTVFRRLAVV